jgi:uncharacterized protein DUF4154
MYEKHLSLIYRRRLFFILAFFFPLALSAQPSGTEYQIKAAYLLNFGKFVKWPSSPSGNSFSICVLGSDPFGTILDSTVRDEKIDAKQVVARRIANVSEATGCQVVFISRLEQGELRKSLPRLTKAGVLTVSDMPGFLDRGGMIQFTLAGNRIRFEVNLDAAQDAELTLSSELLKVASAVRRRRQAEAR